MIIKVPESIDEREIKAMNLTLSRRSTRKTASQRSKVSGQSQKRAKPQSETEIFKLATSPQRVSAFCQASLKNVVPMEFWGQGDVATHNRDLFLKNVHHFICLRRFESLSLHEVLHAMKVGRRRVSSRSGFLLIQSGTIDNGDFMACTAKAHGPQDITD